MLKYPVNFIGITSGFKTASRPTHSGIDLGWNSNFGGKNQPIYACDNGKVIGVVSNKGNTPNDSSSYGNYIHIDHGNGISTFYAHLKENSIKVKIGDVVSQHDYIANMGNTGYSFGEHCHFEVRENGNKVNPVKYCYAYPDQTVASSTAKEYPIMYQDKVDPIPNPEPTPEIPTEPVNTDKFVKGDKVEPTNLIDGTTDKYKDYKGITVKRWDKVYTLSEVKGDRAVLTAIRLGKPSVWCAMNTKNIRKVV